MEFSKIIERINELARKNKSEGLSDAEITERDELRKQYLTNFKNNFRQQLETIEIVDDKDDIKH
ncbi:uncharacterized protein YnzC (UPF0291/DUF896 family) [Paenibacillus endophyticus]|uniref:UPF0291 protein FHS16_001705 n=1 Tax=Paenibacillus endophyticus TaxID=1294268 RepID=A0A7W5G918_9BACL|nr:DUF896 domain-containing protein [Paenibacillus endophyticus]MBB3151659.1 uncharacterized protein YnzC (UPF0291/DUF896 family) [Paenibacillus endophyticus]